MLARYKIYRGKRPPDDVIPEGIRQDRRKHTRHCLRPTAELVYRYLGKLDDDSWNEFASAYVQLLEERFAKDRSPFDHLAQLATLQDVFVGCSCPTAKNPNVNQCHTVLALQFMQERYPDLSVRFPSS